MDEYVSDPAKPVPYIPNIAISMTREFVTGATVGTGAAQGSRRGAARVVERAP